jgi:hypothetical protein
MAGTLVTTNILQTLVSMGLRALRERVVLPRIVNRNVEGDIVGQRVGATVNVAIPAAVATRAVVADVVPPAVTAVTPTSVAVTLDQWQEAPFAMDDKALAQVQRGIVPMQVSEAVKSLANTIDNFLWGLTHDGNGFYGYVGTAGTAPFATDLTQLTQAIKLAEEQLMPIDVEDTFLVLNPAAKANMMLLRQVADASARGSTQTVVRGQIGEIMGVTAVMSQNVPTHTSGADLVGAINDTTGLAVGTTTLVVDGFSAAPNPGDIITIAGDSQTYIATGTPTTTEIIIEPPLKVAIPTADGNEVITVKASHANNLLIQRNAIAFANAPLIETNVTGSAMMETAVDPESGLALRLEVTRQNKQWQWSFDALYGASVVRRELGVRIAG